MPQRRRPALPGSATGAAMPAPRPAPRADRAAAGRCSPRSAPGPAGPHAGRSRCRGRAAPARRSSRARRSGRRARPPATALVPGRMGQGDLAGCSPGGPGRRTSRRSGAIGSTGSGAAAGRGDAVGAVEHAAQRQQPDGRGAIALLLVNADAALAEGAAPACGPRRRISPSGVHAGDGARRLLRRRALTPAGGRSAAPWFPGRRR